MQLVFAKRVGTGLMGLLLSAVIVAQQQPTAKATQVVTIPLNVELSTAINTRQMSTGTPLVAKAVQTWAGPGCTIAKGGTVAGHVVRVATDNAANAVSVTLLFDTADCNGNIAVPYSFFLYAIIAAPEAPYARSPLEHRSLFSAQQQDAIAPTLNHSLGEVPLLFLGKQEDVPRTLALNGVYGMGKVTMQQSLTGNGEATIDTHAKSLRLGMHMGFILVSRTAPQGTLAVGKANSPTLSANTITVTPPPQRAPLAPPQETVVCTASCTVAVEGTPDSGGTPPTVLDMAKLGYGRIDRREMTAFQHANVLTYVGPDRLLLTFDLHRMRRRVSEGPRASFTHTVRAVLIDSHTKQVVRAIDWQVDGEDQYVWAAGRDGVLVHTGDQLRLLDADLATQQTYDLATGELQWVALSPNGKLSAIGILRERHTPEEHTRLRTSGNSEPQEDTEVILLDNTLQPLHTAVQRSNAPPAVLLDDGELEVVGLGGDRWRLDDDRFDGSTHTVAEVRSDLVPTAQAGLGGILFVKGRSAGGSWYRILRLDGRAVLRGTTSPRQVEEASVGADNTFAVRVVRATTGVAPNGRIHTDGLLGEEVTVYRTPDGKPLRSAVLRDVPLTEQSFALSADGQQFAVLGLHSVSIYGLEPKR